MTEYPKSFPFDAVSMMTAAFKAGDFSDVEGLAKAAWVVQGFAMANLIGQGAPPVVVGAAPISRMPRRKAIDALETFVRQNEGARPRRAAAIALPIPWTTLLQLALELVRKLVLEKAATA